LNLEKKGCLPEGDPLHYAHFYNAVALGVVMVASPIYLTHGKDFPVITDPDKFFKFVRKQLQKTFD
jgi:hypothetical protein